MKISTNIPDTKISLNSNGAKISSMRFISPESEKSLKIKSYPNVTFLTGGTADILPFAIVDNYMIRKADGNVSDSLQSGDEVFFRVITNNGDPVLLIGQTYIGGDEQLRSSYEQQTTIDT